eukprot:m.50002 g.50002  ORF g.50002 m.50002 type:complete len:64 (-) comp7190_c0_seq2:45-236(-)
MRTALAPATTARDVWRTAVMGQHGLTVVSVARGTRVGSGTVSDGGGGLSIAEDMPCGGPYTVR